MSAARFQGFPDATFAWFDGLERDNSKAYFTEQRPVYDAEVRGALELLLTELAAEYGGTVRMFRPHRDVRFSADKSPYKTTTYGLLQDRGDGRPSLYAQLSSWGLFAGSGYHMLARDQLERFRAAIAEETSGEALVHAVATARSSGIEVFGEALKTAPKGFPRDHPRVALLRHKALFGGTRIEPGDAGISRRTAIAHVQRTWDGCLPLTEWLEQYVGPSQLPPEPGRGGR